MAIPACDNAMLARPGEKTEEEAGTREGWRRNLTGIPFCLRGTTTATTTQPLNGKKTKQVEGEEGGENQKCLTEL